MKAQRINITLPYIISKQLQTIPQGKRSKFIAESIGERLATTTNPKHQLAKSLKINQAFYEKTAKEWNVTESEGWPK